MMRRLVFALIALLGLGAQTSNPEASDALSVDALIQRARAERSAGDLPAYLRTVESLYARMPWQPTMRYNLARALGLNGRTEVAVNELSALADAGFAFDAAGDVSFDPIRRDPRFVAVAERLSANRKPQGKLQNNLRLGLNGTQPEGIAWSPQERALYVGTIRDGAIYRIFGSTPTRAYERREAGFGIVGLRIDQHRRLLYACASNTDTGEAKLLRLSLPDLQQQAAIAIPAAKAFCNDIALLGDGRVAVTDSDNGRVWILEHERFTPLALPKPLIYPNGIAFDPDGNRLFVAHLPGLIVVDLKTGESRDVASEATPLVGIDGLSFEKGALYAVQNGIEPQRLIRIRPPQRPADKAATEILFAGHKEMRGATTAALMDGRVAILAQTGIPDGSLPDDPLILFVAR